jgi:cytochrome c553
MKKTLLAFIVSALIISLPSNASEMKAPDKFAVCTACHGSDGISLIPTYPNLAGQKKPYLISALNDYKNGKRTGTMGMVMKSQADMLSKEDIEELSDYISKLK